MACSPLVVEIPLLPDWFIFRAQPCRKTNKQTNKQTKVEGGKFAMHRNVGHDVLANRENNVKLQ